MLEAGYMLCFSGFFNPFFTQEASMTASTRLRLPIGIQPFSQIREGGYYYVDKTPVIERLIEQNKFYFLSRPRRFGKSLLLDTLRCLFEGRQELFAGLYIHDRWDWQQTNPVVRLSFGGGVMRSRGELDEVIRDQLKVIRNEHGLVHSDTTSISCDLAALLRDIHS